MLSESPIFNIRQSESSKAISNNRIWNSYTNKYVPANSFNTLPSAYYFGRLYNEKMLFKQRCYIASGGDGFIAERMYNEMDYVRVIEYYIINLTLKLDE